MNNIIRNPSKSASVTDAGPAANVSSQRQTVLVLQGGGALGAYQAGVYQALVEGGIEPDWVIGTSIGAINAALIAGNEPQDRLPRLREFWDGVSRSSPIDEFFRMMVPSNIFANMGTLTRGIPGFFEPNPSALFGINREVGVENASYYSTDPLKRTLGNLVDFDYLNRRHTRLTVGAVNVNTSELRYFDSSQMPLSAAHIMASGALPPAFPAVCINGEPYWDGGVYSNTPIEVVLDARPRRDALIFAVNMWQPRGSEPKSIWQVMGRQKDLQYASRGRSHVARQEQLHRLRHVVREMGKLVPEERRDDPMFKELASYGCPSVMHLVRLLSPRLHGEDHTKDIDFTRSGIRTRWQAGYEHGQRVLSEKPWECEVDMLQGIVIHESQE
ncbi:MULTISPECIES: patatin-like phospholipase family protein [unclassified Mesorhizobium]|uniref:patatin-like phospholipase family protein n=1 Tax=unclassified Mesorhizobium TaxID=325217 RepID=UPI000FCBE513|nr:MULTISPECIES: patatin-like phospholipase family protein [unclassified Mesorhizobium]RUW38022.1 patatin-like phospholipase family protein [Mesorhizobium sp. M1E.F.Ca.ET.041.01.1.1]RWD88879.1 MAG: patatin-like phospholipase family protein [Mesorhizobium sp.]RWD90673.1 MAG: patatin-like phospholipase family protein [Mesorhizobium sp.]TIV54646.1 MAG: patatin-like phospholipase family protein [Mesorhizobium sp.]